MRWRAIEPRVVTAARQKDRNRDRRKVRVMVNIGDGLGRVSAIHFDFSSAIPETPSRVSRARFSPISRPVGSYHSCSEWAPPPVPPAPMEMASMPLASGMLASVEERSTRDWLPT